MLHKKFGLKSVGLPEGSVNSTVGTTGASAEPSAPDLWTHYDSVRKDLMRIGLDAPVMTKGEFSKGTDAPFVISVETKKSIERVSTAVQVLFGVTSSALIAVGSGGTMYGWIIPKQYQKETHSLTITDRKTDTVYYSDLESLDSRAAKDHAARAAGELGAVAIPMLTFALCNESSSVRQASAEALLRIGGPVTRDLLVESLKSETDIFTARKVFEVLERLNDARGRETIIANLSARNPEIRAAALILIGETRRIDAIGKVLEALKDADERVRIAAHETLKTFAEPSVAENSSEPSDNTVNRISSMYPESAGAIPAIVSALRHDSPEVRAGAADVLGDVGDSGSVVHLMRSLSDSDPRVRSAAASALGRIKDPRAVGPLAKLSQDDADDGVRNSAKDALEWMDVKVGESDTIFQSPGESIPTDQLHRTAVGGADNDKKETPGIVPEDKGGGSPSKEPKNGEERELISEYVRMGEVFLAGGDYARAIDVYSRILNIDEGNRDALEGIRRANDARSAEELERNKLESSQIPERRKENPRAN
ncbi:MAG: HEAT repeat domain-containing protein [Deltaproteobacteria bacterium]|nr:HEAT repeat domain-containing protein [Deltaproteobacteria bacterium]